MATADELGIEHAAIAELSKTTRDFDPVTVLPCGCHQRKSDGKIVQCEAHDVDRLGYPGPRR